jgi:hypothetical protein
MIYIRTTGQRLAEAMMGTMKPLKRSVAVVVGRLAGPADGASLIVLRPDDPDDPLAGAWGPPA